MWAFINVSLTWHGMISFGALGGADTLEALHGAVRIHYKLAKTRIHALCGEEPPDANLLLVAHVRGRTARRLFKIVYGRYYVDIGAGSVINVI
jgi:hypothetical protein